MMKAKYKYNLRKVKKHPFIMIEGSNSGGRTVTNDIVNVIKDIAKKKNLNPCKFTIIYKDTEGIWDGFDFATKSFFPIREAHWLKASIKFLNKEHGSSNNEVGSKY